MSPLQYSMIILLYSPRLNPRVGHLRYATMHIFTQSRTNSARKGYPLTLQPCLVPFAGWLKEPGFHLGGGGGGEGGHLPPLA